jgi:hypothetical protein
MELKCYFSNIGKTHLSAAFDFNLDNRMKPSHLFTFSELTLNEVRDIIFKLKILASKDTGYSK